MWSHGTLEVVGILDDAGDEERQPAPFCHFDGLRRAFVGMDAPEEHEVVANLRPHLEGPHVDAVVDGRDVVESLMPVGVADGDVVSAGVVALEHRHDALG